MLKTCLLLILEILPIMVFFGVGQRLPFLQALVMYLVTTVITILVIWAMAKRVSYLALIFGVVIITAGSLSISFNNPDILLIADTLYYLGAAFVLLILQYRGYLVMKLLFNGVFGMQDTGWRILNTRWIWALALAGASNELVRQIGTTDDWLWFQLVRTIAIILFATYQFTLTKKYRLETDDVNSWGIRI